MRWARWNRWKIRPFLRKGKTKESIVWIRPLFQKKGKICSSSISSPGLKVWPKGCWRKLRKVSQAPGQTSLCPEEKNVKRKFEIWQRPYYNNISPTFWKFGSLQYVAGHLVSSPIRHRGHITTTFHQQIIIISLGVFSDSIVVFLRSSLHKKIRAL